MKNIFFISIDPLIHRRRVINQIETAKNMGWNVSAISVGPHIQDKAGFPVFYINRPFKKGPLKFLHFNLKTFNILKKEKVDIIHARGLWVLPSILVFRFFKKFKLIYDAHEFFAGHELFQNHLWRRLTWLKLEKAAVSKIDSFITVSEPLGEFYKKLYPNIKRLDIIRSLPKQHITKIEKKVDDKKIKEIVFHGYFLPGRGLIQLIQATSKIENPEFHLTLIGEGILENELKKEINKNNMSDKISIEPMVESGKLLNKIETKDLGIALIEADSINRKYALPNKFFEYIQAGIPVLASNIPTLMEYVEKYQVGLTANPNSIDDIAEKLQTMLSDSNLFTKFSANCFKASKELCWENESKKLKNIYYEISNPSDRKD
ncbi:MAG: glycosyltransferase [Calditrichaeota bacterium]|nr:MAG: glycosyltransferase [Calditrichota bacterium]MBL1207309.1 glycosyltransferase [Calditrichota bacterium]NOG47141.1 glycosyltransferase [Calditrichota bacterium]